eukprot:9485860-Pyramimonas_sp.AAC.1
MQPSGRTSGHSGEGSFLRVADRCNSRKVRQVRRAREVRRVRWVRLGASPGLLDALSGPCA